MCGIVGLFCKNPELELSLGPYLSAMLVQMDDRGPDSAGVAIYRDPAPDGCSKLTLYSADPAEDWQALEGCLDDLDGFYTFLVGTIDGFAVLRDPIACKPAVLAETDDWVAMASEYRAIAVLPGASEATMWEPEPSVVYAWEKEAVPA